MAPRAAARRRGCSCSSSRKVAAPLATAYDWYSFNVLPRIGQLVAGDEASYRYLAESIRVHPDQATLKSMMERAGFDHVDCTTSPPASSPCTSDVCIRLFYCVAD